MTPRKLRLWGCACVRAVQQWLRDSRSLDAIELAEAYADGQIEEGDRLAALRRAEGAANAIFPSYADVAFAAAGLLSDTLTDGVAIGTAEVVASSTANGVYAILDSDDEVWQQARSVQSDLLRHIIGNPWRPLVSPAHWPATIIKLAEAQYEGEDCSMALHDALLEEGYNDFAQHFREGFHPKGCWATDLILGKK